MGAAERWLAMRWLRRRAVAVVPLALVVAVGTAGAALALGAAEHTSTAYRDYLEAAEVGDVVVNPSVSTKEVDEVIRSLPGVEVVTSHTLFTVTEDAGAPRARMEIEGGDRGVEFVLGSSDGRFSETDRPIVRTGRLATGTREIVLNVDAAEATGLGPGDQMTLSFWQTGLPDGLAGDDLERFSSERVEPIGVEELDVVGVVTLSDEVLPDDLYPRSKAIVSPDVAARYECLPSTPPPGSTFAEAKETLLPADCAAAYRYYSLAFTDGAAGVEPALAEFIAKATAMNADLADISDLDELEGTAPPQYFLIPTETRREVDRVERAVLPTVTGLGVLGASAAAVTVLLAGLAAAREVRRSHPDLRQWRELGMGATSRAAIVGLPLVLAAVAGVAVGAIASRMLDPGPMGLVAVVESSIDHPIPRLGLMGCGAVVAAVVVTVAVLSLRAARRPVTTPIRASGTRTVLRLAGTRSPAVAEGVRGAYGTRAGVPVLVGCAVLTAGFVAAVTFGTSLSSLLSTPRSYGWPWEAAALTGAGYGDLDVDGAAALLDEHPDVERWSTFGFLNEVTLDGQAMMTLVGLEQVSSFDLPVVEGKKPVAADEVAVGATTAADRGLSVGDAVEIGGPFEPQRMRVSGIVVFPSLGPVLADRVGTGTGLLIPQAIFENPDLQPLAADAAGLASFVGVDLRDGTGSDVVSSVQAQLEGLDLLGQPARLFAAPVRPPEIIDARATRSVPGIVGVVFAATAAIALAFVSWASVRARRRDLAVLRALGFTRNEVRRSVSIQSLATMALALVLGVPAGLVAGRFVWRAFAGQLGVVSEPSTPLLALVAAVGGGLALALLAAQVPSRVAGGARPADGLRRE